MSILRTPKYLIIHCSALSSSHNAIDVHKWHLNRKFSGIGYHDIIEQNGERVRGRPWYWKGSHCRKARRNHDSLGVCLLGNTKFSDKQMATLVEYIKEVVEQYPDIIVCGHRDWEEGKTCPNFSVKRWVKSIPELSHVRTL